MSEATKTPTCPPWATRLSFGFLSLAAFALLGGGLLLGEYARLHPCYLCNFQRFLYIVLGVICLAGVALPTARRLWSLGAAITSLAGIVAAGYQSWMQFAPERVVACGFGERTLVEMSVDWLSAMWPSLFMVTGSCSSKEWALLGLSLANWSLICFLAFLAGSIALTLKNPMAYSTHRFSDSKRRFIDKCRQLSE